MMHSPTDIDPQGSRSGCSSRCGWGRRGRQMDRLRPRLEHLDRYDPSHRECDQDEKEDDSIALHPLLHVGSQRVQLGSMSLTMRTGPDAGMAGSRAMTTQTRERFAPDCTSCPPDKDPIPPTLARQYCQSRWLLAARVAPHHNVPGRRRTDPVRSSTPARWRPTRWPSCRL
jgi:hypothetical protein